MNADLRERVAKAMWESRKYRGTWEAGTTETERADYLHMAAAALSVAQGQGFVMVPGAYVDPRGKPVLTNEGDNMTPAILARRGLRPVYELNETREPDKPIPENCRHDWATDGMGDYCRYCKKREDSLFPAAPAQPDGVNRD